MLVPIDDIRIGKRLRGLREAAVGELLESIARLGLQVPISVATGVERRPGDADGVSFILVAGAHRLEACKRLGLVEIEANIVQMNADECLLWEIDENLCRADLTELERGEHLLKRKEVYERKHPQTKVGGDHGNQYTGGKRQDSPSATFAIDTADKTGIAARTVRQSINRAKKIDERVRDRIREMPEISDSGTELDALAHMEPAQQKRAVDLVEAGKASGIRDAKKLIDGPAKVAPHFKSDQELSIKWRAAFTALMNRVPNPADREWAREQLDEIIADNTEALRVA